MRRLYYITAGLAVLFAVWLAFSLYTYLGRADDTRETLRQARLTDRIFASEDNPVQSAREAMANDDIIAHIYVPGTAISYAVVQAADNEFYLYHDITRRGNSNGAIFLDYLNSSDFSDRNTIIYGHNRSDGTMFHDIQLFQDYSFFRGNPYIIITAEDAVLHYEIFAVFTAHISFNYIRVDFADDYDFLDLLLEIKDRAIHLRETEITGSDRVLILSTCTNIGLTGRLVLAAKKLDNADTAVIP